MKQTLQKSTEGAETMHVTLEDKHKGKAGPIHTQESQKCLYINIEHQKIQVSNIKNPNSFKNDTVETKATRINPESKWRHTQKLPQIDEDEERFEEEEWGERNRREEWEIRSSITFEGRGRMTLNWDLISI